MMAEAQPRLRSGTDLVRVDRIDAVITRHGDRFLQRVFTEGELAWCGKNSESLAARWAAKEAVAKALGTGIGAVGFREIEVVQQPCGPPVLRLWGDAARLARELGLSTWTVSLAHEAGLALAFVVAIG